MKRIAIAALTGMVIAWASSAQASTDYSASLVLDGGLPALRIGIPALDGPHNLDGTWTTYSDPRAKGFTRDSDDAGNWGAWQGNIDMHRYASPPFQMGEVWGRNTAAAGGLGEAWASVSHTSMVATATTTVLGRTEVDSKATWERGFSLAANTSMTFATLCTLGIGGDDSPLDSVIAFAFNPAGSFASLSMADALDRVGVRLWGSLAGDVPLDLASIFSYTTGPNGALALTINNTTGGMLNGMLGAATYVNVSAAIPEPESVALMLLGLAGTLGAVRRRRANQSVGMN